MKISHWIAIILLPLLLWQVFLPAARAEKALEFVYLSPAPGAKNISPTTSLAVRQGETLSPEALKLQSFLVNGSQSGIHSGAVRLSDDHRTLLFYPDQPFAYGETVHVTVGEGLHTQDGRPVASASFSFSTLMQPLQKNELENTRELPLNSANLQPSEPQSSPRYQTYPEFGDLTSITVTTPATGTAEGLVFLTNTGLVFPTDPALYIIDNSGEPVYIQLFSPEWMLTDFKRQMVGGKPYLVYHQGDNQGAWSYGQYNVMDTTYTITDTWTIENGYGADLHEIQLLQNGHAWLLGYYPVPYDLTQYGGSAEGSFVEIVIQEQDTDKNVVFEWFGSFHVDLADTYQSFLYNPVDFMHTNAISVEPDGNLLISNRNTSDIIKIDIDTGDIIWRLGGKQNNFVFTNDGGFSRQHDVRRLSNGHITLFDNGNDRIPQYSRAVEYALDESAMTASLVWQYAANQSLFAPYMGSAQRLENGNTLMGWGSLPHVNEVLPDGREVFKLDMNGLSYRAFRFPWEAIPAAPPRLALQSAGDPSVATLFLAWNGATQIDAYEIYGGLTITTTSLITTTLRTGFETRAELTDLAPDTCVFQMRPLHHDGLEMPISNLAYRLDMQICVDTLLPHKQRLPLILLP